VVLSAAAAAVRAWSEACREVTAASSAAAALRLLKDRAQIDRARATMAAAAVSQSATDEFSPAVSEAASRSAVVTVEKGTPRVRRFGAAALGHTALPGDDRPCT
jgi:Xaa-Pro aminopeptidase